MEALSGKHAWLLVATGCLDLLISDKPKQGTAGPIRPVANRVLCGCAQSPVVAIA